MEQKGARTMPRTQTVILVAESDSLLLYQMSSALCREGYSVLHAHDGLHALEQVIMAHPHLLIAEEKLPCMSGFELSTRVREFSTMPIIVLTATGRDHDRVHGLNPDVDDVLTRPFAIDELLARVRSVLRWIRMKNDLNVSALQAIVTLGALTVDCGQGRVNMNGRPVNLTSTEYRLLIALIRHLGHVVPDQALLDQVWGVQRRKAALLPVIIKRLRHKLEPDPVRPQYIQTKPGVGYLLGSPHTP
jgi:DNA-binding response OmpR family regulator